MRRGLLASFLLVLATAAGLVVVFLQRSQEPSHRIECSMHLQRIGKAVHLYHGSHKTLPASCIAPGYATWAVQVGPFLEQDHGKSLKAWDLGLPYYSQAAPAREAQVWVYYCPARRYPPQLSVAGDGPPGGAQGNLAGALGDFGCAPASRCWQNPGAPRAPPFARLREKHRPEASADSAK